MPIYEFACPSNHTQEHLISTDQRDSVHPRCTYCHKAMKRLPGGKGLLYFEEGRGRTIEALSDRPITSKAEHRRLMRQAGVVESGDTIPQSVRKNPKHSLMKERVAGGVKGRWF